MNREDTINAIAMYLWKCMETYEGDIVAGIRLEKLINSRGKQYTYDWFTTLGNLSNADLRKIHREFTTSGILENPKMAYLKFRLRITGKMEEWEIETISEIIEYNRKSALSGYAKVRYFDGKTGMIYW